MRRTVFRFRYLDRASGQMKLAEDWATAEAIAQMGGEIVPGSAMEVESAQVSATAGILVTDRGAA